MMGFNLSCFEGLCIDIYKLKKSIEFIMTYFTTMAVTHEMVFGTDGREYPSFCPCDREHSELIKLVKIVNKFIQSMVVFFTLMFDVLR